MADAARTPPWPPCRQRRPGRTAQQASQLLAAAAGLANQPSGLREAIWLSSALVQKPFPQRSVVCEYPRKALAEFSRVYDQGALGFEGSLLAATCLIHLDQRQAAASGLAVLAKYHPNEKDPHRLLAAIYMDVNVPKAAIEHLSCWARSTVATAGPIAGSATSRATTAIPRRRSPPMRRRSPHLVAGLAVQVVQELAEIYVGTQGDYAGALSVLEQCPEEYRQCPAFSPCAPIA